MSYSEAGRAPAPGADSQADERRTGSNWFFVCMATVLLVIVAVGFAKSFYLRSVIYKGHANLALPGYIVIHGIALTSWFLLFFAQTLLVVSEKVRLHRSLGIVGASLAAIVFVLSFLVVVRSVARETSLVVLGDMVILLLFAGLITVGVLRRRKPDVHKRLMLVASICIVAPAMARWPGAQSRLPISVLGPQLVLFAALILYDVLSRRRVHRATVWGLSLYFVACGVTISLAFSKLGQALVAALK